MKKQLVSLMVLALMVLVSCKEPAATEAVETPDYAAFDSKVSVIRAFYKAHSQEDLATLSSMLADTMQWSPPNYNGNQWLGKEDFLATLKAYHENYDNIQFTEGIVLPDSTANGFWSGSVFPKGTASSTPSNIRTYGTWTATHTESGQKVGVKYYSLSMVNNDGKIATFSDYLDINSLMPKPEEKK